MAFCGILFGEAETWFILLKESHGSFGYYAENLGPRQLKMDVQNLQTFFPSASVLNIFVLLSYLYKVENDGFPYSIFVEVDLVTIQSSLIVWWGLYKRDMEIIYTKQEMIWHGRQEVEPHIQQQDLKEILHSFLFSCSSKSYFSDSHLKSYIYI